MGQRKFCRKPFARISKGRDGVHAHQLLPDFPFASFFWALFNAACKHIKSNSRLSGGKWSAEYFVAPSQHYIECEFNRLPIPTCVSFLHDLEIDWKVKISRFNRYNSHGAPSL